MTPAVLDITILTIILLSTLVAAWRGFVRELFTIVGLIASFIGAWKGGHFFVPVFEKWLKVPPDGGDKAAEAVSKGTGAEITSQAAIDAAHRKADLILGVISPGLFAKVCAYGTAFMIVFLVMALVSFFVSRSIQEMGLGFVDRAVGAVFGFLRGFLIVFLPFVLCLVLVGEDKFPDWAKNSVSVPAMQEVYAYADENYDLGQFVEDKGNAIVLKLDKVDPDEIGKDEAAPSLEESELKESLSREEQERAP